MSNNGNSIKMDLKRMTKQQKYKFAESFCEGSIELKNLLLKMWDNGIETYGCCIGHDNGLKPYLFFETKNFKSEKLKTLLLTAMHYCKKEYIDISISKDYYFGQEFERQGISFYCNINKISVNEFFNMIDKLVFDCDDISICKLSKYENEIINATMNLYAKNLTNYLKSSRKSPACQIGGVNIYVDKGSCSLRVINNMQCKSFKILDTKGQTKRYLLAEGFYRKVDGKYYTVKDDKLLELNSNSLKNYIAFKKYKKYNFLIPFSIDAMNRVLNEMG